MLLQSAHGWKKDLTRDEVSNSDVKTLTTHGPGDQGSDKKDTPQCEKREKITSRVRRIEEVHRRFMAKILKEDLCCRYHTELRKHIKLLQSLRPLNPEDVDTWTPTDVQTQVTLHINTTSQSTSSQSKRLQTIIFLVNTQHAQKQDEGASPVRIQ